MQRLFSKENTRWLLPALLILFILELMTLPLVLGYTYTARSETPNHVLTYTKGKLIWDSATGIGANGAAELDLFDAVYDHVESADGKNIVASGTEGYSIVRLQNRAIGPVEYTAVLYRIRTSDTLPVEASLVGTFTDTTSYPLPSGVSSEHVIRAVKGTVKNGAIKDFDISWQWAFYENDLQDTLDTALGSADESDTVTVGLYIVVEDNNSYVVPKTGDNSQLAIYLTLMLISLTALILLVFQYFKEKKCTQ